MSQALHLITNTIPGYGPSESRHLPRSLTSAKSVALFPLSPFSNNRTYALVKARSLKYASGATFFVCRASSGGPRRNSDFSKQNRQSFSRNRNRHNEEKDTFENLDESDLLMSKNGPLLSHSNTTKFQATAAAGPREKEIVELFRKVQAKLRERAAGKEEKKVETTKGKGKESETVDSLLKLLRKHSIEQGKKKVSNISSGDFGLDQPEEHNGESKDRSSSSHSNNNKDRSAIAQPISTSISRPPSKFRRKSPVPKTKFDAIYSSEGPINSSYMDLTVKEKEPFKAVPDKDKQPQLDMDMEETELELEEEQESSSYPDGGVFNELLAGEPFDTENDDEGNDKESHTTEYDDLSSLKLAELRALAKSRGIKGYSKMKKGDLVELLSSK